MSTGSDALGKWQNMPHVPACIVQKSKTMHSDLWWHIQLAAHVTFSWLKFSAWNTSVFFIQSTALQLKALGEHSHLQAWSTIELQQNSGRVALPIALQSAECLTLSGFF